MLLRLKTIRNNINLSNLNNSLLIISLIMFTFSIYFLNNKYWFLVIIVLLYELYNHTKKNKYLKLIMDISFIITLGYFLLTFIDLSFFNFNILKYIKILIKVLFLVTYFWIIICEISNKKIKHLKRKKKSGRSFNELRKSKINYYKEKRSDYINSYIKEHNIDATSDYYKLIKANLASKTKEEMEEYIKLEYLRFYKNRALVKKNIFDKFNIVFLLIHVIILLLVILVR